MLGQEVDLMIISLPILSHCKPSPPFTLGEMVLSHFQAPIHPHRVVWKGIIQLLSLQAPHTPKHKLPLAGKADGGSQITDK